MHTLLAAVLFTANGATFTWSPSFPPQGRRLDDSTIVLNLAAAPREAREACGWYDLADTPPKTYSNEVAVAVGYRRVAMGYERVYRVQIAPPSAVRYSTLSICRELRKLGKWDKVKALLTEGGVWDDYYLANYLASTDETFIAASKAIVAQGILTQSELDALLPKCMWTAE